MKRISFDNFVYPLRIPPCVYSNVHVALNHLIHTTMPPLSTASVSLASIPPYASASAAEAPIEQEAPFHIDNAVNSKIKLFRGKVYSVDADAALIATNESFSER